MPSRPASIALLLPLLLAWSCAKSAVKPVVDGGAIEDGGAIAAAGAGARNWSAHPAIEQLAAASSLYVFSDVHGDYQALLKLLAGGGVIDTAHRWKAGDAVLVVVGDLIDKGPDSVDVIRFFIALQSSAAATGGHVIVTMGNHEAQFLADPKNGKATASDGFDPELRAAGLSPESVAAGVGDVGLFVRDLPFAARVGDWFFAHAGNTGGRTLARLSSDLQRGVDAAGFGAPVLSASDSLLEMKLSQGAFWEAAGTPEATLAQWTSALGVHHLVMGHQPSAVTFADGVQRKADTIFQRYGTVFLVDTGLSQGVDGTGGALLHVPNPADAGSAEVITPNGARTPLRAR
jgi:hypothetical protein